MTTKLIKWNDTILGFNNNLIGQYTYCPEFQDVYDYWTNKPSDEDAVIWNNMVETLISSRVWATRDAFYFTAIHTNNDGEAQVNWKNPGGAYDLTLINSPTFTQYEGFTGAAGKALDTNYIPLSNAVKFLVNAFSNSVYQRDNNTNGSMMGCWDSLNVRNWIAWDSTTTMTFGLNRTGHVVLGVNQDRGMHIYGTYMGHYINNGVDKVDMDYAGITLPNRSLYIGAMNWGFIYRGAAKQYSHASIGGLLDIDNDITLAQSLTNAVETALDAKGKGVAS